MAQQLESLKPTLTKRQIIDSKHRYTFAKKKDFSIDFYFRYRSIITNS